eukprot:gnl/TRDRNA2_/TRDRNA2_191783_c0_seq1.p2 gnl/TRDRNA2_/TRDRNA2_191783_c0~~gnl/TRDRNA2_/TRDRNA2_191783_c0_seq1.p2  ORF type:complete len:210 (-),score=76.41 gnl/TRDRNA2_/TRDRNA2_191783_c0_seq1:42-671(-)
MAKRTKGLSFDEKKATLLAAMNAEASFYTLKELESLGKAKGVIPQAVKEVVESLEADGAVRTDKVGTQTLFWALPSQKAAALRAKRQKIGEETTKLKAEHKKIQAELAELESNQKPISDDEVVELKMRVNKERQERDALKAKVAAYERCGPAKVEEMRKQIVVAKEAANRWADNICSVRSQFVRERRGEVSTKQFNQSFGLPDDFDYLE